MDYHALAEQLLQQQARLHLLPFYQELAVWDHGMFSALNYLRARQAPAYPKELSRSMGVSSARVATLLNHLEKEGLVLRSPDMRDNRQVMVSLTEKGRQAICQKRARMLALAVQTLQALGPEDAAALVRIQQKLAQRFLQPAAAAAPPNATKQTEVDDFTA